MIICGVVMTLLGSYDKQMTVLIIGAIPVVVYTWHSLIKDASPSRDEEYTDWWICVVTACMFIGLIMYHLCVE